MTANRHITLDFWVGWLSLILKRELTEGGLGGKLKLCGRGRVVFKP